MSSSKTSPKTLRTFALLGLTALLLVGCRPPGGQTEGAAGATGARGAPARGTAGNDLDAAPSKTLETAVRASPVRAGRLDTRRSVGANISARRDSNVAAQTGAAVRAVLVPEGQTVRAGQVVVQLDDTTLRDGVENARIALQNAQINLQQASSNASQSAAQLRSAVEAAQASFAEAQAKLRANRELYAVGGISRADLQASEAQAANAESTLAGARTNLAQNGRSGSGSLALLQNAVENAQASLRQAQQNLAKAAVRAPFGGTVAQIEVAEGEFVNTGATVFRLVDTGSLQAEFRVPPPDAARLPEGARVTVSYNNRQMDAQVVQGNRVAGTDRLVPLRADLAGANIPVGTTVQLAYDVTLGAGTLVPTGALQSDGDQTYVYVVQNGAARRVNVSVVAENAGQVAVSGLSAGARLVNPVPPSLQDGAPVRVQSEQAGSSPSTPTTPNTPNTAPQTDPQGGTP